MIIDLHEGKTVHEIIDEVIQKQDQFARPEVSLIMSSSYGRNAAGKLIKRVGDWVVVEGYEQTLYTGGVDKNVTVTYSYVHLSTVMGVNFELTQG